MFDYIIGFIFEELTFSLNDLLFRGGSGDRGSGNEVNPLFRLRGDWGVFENYNYISLTIETILFL